MNIINQRKFELFLKDYDVDFKGWNFSHIESTHRVQEFPLDWSYRSIVLTYLAQSNKLLDMGTGGGEFLSSLPMLPEFTYATESYLPNIDIAKNRLHPLGINVIETLEDGNLPFLDQTFDLIINRHEYYNPKEVYRILKSKSFFITQQVGNQNAIELENWFDAHHKETGEWSLNKACLDLLSSGFVIERKEEMITKTRFYDLGAVLYYLKAVPWQIEDFALKKYLPRIIDLHNRIEVDGFFDVSCHRLLLITRK